eukprot:4866492-Prymnesium_polylepis.1
MRSGRLSGETIRVISRGHSTVASSPVSGFVSLKLYRSSCAARLVVEVGLVAGVVSSNVGT